MYPTVEVRWFREGAIPGDVQRWFHASKQAPLDQPPRTDYYLRLGCDQSLGIKLREGRIERKVSGGKLKLFAQTHNDFAGTT